MKTKKTLKIITGAIVFLTLPSLLFFGFLYFKYNEDLPTGIQGEKADALAYNMLEALDYEKQSTILITILFGWLHLIKFLMMVLNADWLKLITIKMRFWLLIPLVDQLPGILIYGY